MLGLQTVRYLVNIVYEVSDLTLGYCSFGEIHFNKLFVISLTMFL